MTIEEASPRETQRIADTLACLPAHLGRVLEVGCGDGRLGRVLAARATRYIGLDIPWPFAQRPEGLVYGSIASLPFADRSIDTVVCCEVLEHLDDATFQAGLRELRRVARRTLLVTVPHAQHLAADAVRCPSCAHVFHRYSHVRRFEVADVARLWPDLQPDVATPLGDPVRGYAPPLAYRLQHALGAYPVPVWECAACGRRPASRQPSLVTRASRAVLGRLERLAPRRAPWAIARWTVS